MAMISRVITAGFRTDGDAHFRTQKKWLLDAAGNLLRLATQSLLRAIARCRHRRTPRLRTGPSPIFMMPLLRSPALSRTSQRLVPQPRALIRAVARRRRRTRPDATLARDRLWERGSGGGAVKTTRVAWGGGCVGPTVFGTAGEMERRRGSRGEGERRRQGRWGEGEAA